MSVCLHENPCVCTSRDFFVKYWNLFNPSFIIICSMLAGSQRIRPSQMVQKVRENVQDISFSCIHCFYKGFSILYNVIHIKLIS